MTTLTRIIAVSIISLLLLSCNFLRGVDGNGNVIKTDRTISQDFDQISVSHGLDLQLTQANAVSITVEADENLLDLIMTEVVNGTLRIYTTENIGHATSKKVVVNFENVSGIKATSGSDVYSSNTIEVPNLEVSSTSGADVTLAVKTKTLNCNATSGSDISMSGTTKALVANATSGSDIDASNLKAETSNVKATSGADISVNTTKTLVAKATSGGDIKYIGDPEIIEKSDNSAGRVEPQH